MLLRLPLATACGNDRDGTTGSGGTTLETGLTAEDTGTADNDDGADETGTGPARLPVTRFSVGTTFDAEALRP